MIRPKKVVLFPEIGRVKLFLSLTRPHSRMCIRVLSFSFKKQTSKQKAPKIQKKAKETKEEKRIFPENRLKKIFFGRRGEECFPHPHFRKQLYFFGLMWMKNVNNFQIAKVQPQDVASTCLIFCQF